MRFIIITGLSGSGKSTAAKVLEDEGFYVIDNFPITLLPSFFEQGGGDIVDRVGVAIVMDVRNPHFMTGCEDVFDVVKAAGYQLEVFFFDAADDDLVRRFRLPDVAILYPVIIQLQLLSLKSEFCSSNCGL